MIERDNDNVDNEESIDESYIKHYERWNGKDERRQGLGKSKITNKSSLFYRLENAMSVVTIIGSLILSILTFTNKIVMTNVAGGILWLILSFVSVLLLINGINKTNK